MAMLAGGSSPISEWSCALYLDSEATQKSLQLIQIFLCIVLHVVTTALDWFSVHGKCTGSLRGYLHNWIPSWTDVAHRVHSWRWRYESYSDIVHKTGVWILLEHFDSVPVAGRAIQDCCAYLYWLYTASEPKVSHCYQCGGSILNEF